MRGQAAGSYPLITLRAGLVRYRQGISDEELRSFANTQNDR